MNKPNISFKGRLLTRYALKFMPSIEDKQLPDGIAVTNYEMYAPEQDRKDANPIHYEHLTIDTHALRNAKVNIARRQIWARSNNIGYVICFALTSVFLTLNYGIQSSTELVNNIGDKFHRASILKEEKEQGRKNLTERFAALKQQCTSGAKSAELCASELNTLNAQARNLEQQ